MFRFGSMCTAVPLRCIFGFDSMNDVFPVSSMTYVVVLVLCILSFRFYICCRSGLAYVSVRFDLCCGFGSMFAIFRFDIYPGSVWCLSRFDSYSGSVRGMLYAAALVRCMFRVG